MATAPAPTWDETTVRARLESAGFHPRGPLPPVAWFGDDRDQARELGDLVRRGRKTATAGLLWKWAHDRKRPPRPGDRQVIVDWEGTPLAVIEMTEVQVLPFDAVDDEFARDEGEGDLSLDYWRAVHWRFLTRECRRIGREPHPAMPTLCMRFRLVHPVPDPNDRE